LFRFFNKESHKHGNHTELFSLLSPQITPRLKSP
jgi:hypothetical protein